MQISDAEIVVYMQMLSECMQLLSGSPRYGCDNHRWRCQHLGHVQETQSGNNKPFHSFLTLISH